MNLGEQIVVYLGIALLVWYVGASTFNRRLGIRTYRWLQPGVAGLGKITEAKWIGSSGSGARLGVAQAHSPLRKVEVSYLLETRELLPLWLINRLRGRRDTIYVRAQLRSAPYGELEVLPAGDRRFAGLLAGKTPSRWAMASGSLPHGMQAAWRGRDTEHLLGSAIRLLERSGAAIRRLSIAQTPPHIILEAQIPQLIASPSEAFFAALSRAFIKGGAEGAEPPLSGTPPAPAPAGPPEIPAPGTSR